MPINTIQIKSLDAEGRGVGHLSNEDGTPGKVVFVEGALPGEVVHFETVKKKSKWELAKMISLFRESPVLNPCCDRSLSVIRISFHFI